VKGEPFAWEMWLAASEHAYGHNMQPLWLSDRSEKLFHDFLEVLAPTSFGGNMLLLCRVRGMYLIESTMSKYLRWLSGDTFAEILKEEMSSGCGTQVIGRLDAGLCVRTPHMQHSYCCCCCSAAVASCGVCGACRPPGTGTHGPRSQPLTFRALCSALKSKAPPGPGIPGIIFAADMCCCGGGEVGLLLADWC
jgi:hypothetical protein